MGTNNFQTKNPGDVISSDDPNQYKIGLTQDVVPRNSSGVPTDQAGSLGSSTYSWLNGFFRKIFPGNPANNHTITSDANGILLNPGDVSSFRVRKTGTPSTPVDFYNAANDFTMSVGGTAAGGYTAAAGQLLPKLRSQTFNATGTWTNPGSVLGGIVFLYGMGGGGGGAGGNGNWPGGGGAGAKAQWTPMVASSGNIVMTIGGGGGGGAANTNGNNGGSSTAANSTLGITASFAGAVGGNGPAGTNPSPRAEGDIHSNFNYHYGGNATSSSSGAAGGSSMFYNGGNGGSNSGLVGGGGGGGAGSYGVGGNGANASSAGSAAAANTGGGGGGASNSNAGGTGGSGKIVIYWFDSKDFS